MAKSLHQPPKSVDFVGVASPLENRDALEYSPNLRQLSMATHALAEKAAFRSPDLYSSRPNTSRLGR